jgi:hypothetical protein
VAICCDNTTVSNTSLPEEERRLARLGLPPDTLAALHVAARGHSFMRDERGGPGR